MRCPPGRPRRFVGLLATLAATLAVGSACTGGDGPAGGAPPAEVLAAAATELDATSGLRVALSTDDLPADVDGAVAADGVGVHPPAFEGTITVNLGGARFEVPVVAVDGRVYAQLPLTAGWSDIDPAEYNAPDPARLMSPRRGLSALLAAADDLAVGETVRGGEDNAEILTEYTGTVPARAARNVIPSARGEFDATYTVAESGQLRRIALTGVFYPGQRPMTYTVDLTDYGIERDVTAP